MWLYVSSFRLCVCVYVGTYLVETMSRNVLEVAWKVGLFIECVAFSCQLFKGN
jgi:hypothetical protein